MQEKKSYDARDIYMISDIILQIQTVRMYKNEFQTWCSNFTKIQRLTSLGSLLYWDKCECMREKEDFGRKKKKRI